MTLLGRTRLLGGVEALATPHGLDRYLELLHPMLTVRELRAEVTGVHHGADDSVTITLRPTRQWRGFAAGQFVQLTVDVDGVRHTRCYSPASSAHRPDGRFEITVRAHPAGVVSQYLHAHAVPGLVVGLTQADGTFRLPARRPASVRLVSGGSGITPVMSMLRTLLDERYAGEIDFLHYARDEAHVPYRDELHALAEAHPNVRVRLAYTRARRGGPDRRGPEPRGHFRARHLDGGLPAATFVCGPEPLQAALREHYASRGAADTLHTESFTLGTAAVPDGDASGTLRFERDGSSAENTGATLLEQAEAAGLTPPHGCRMGICFSCTQVKRSGCTRDVRSGETNSDPDVEVQLCVNVPVGDVTLDL